METSSQVSKKVNCSERLTYIDSVKGVGIVLVILGHHLLSTEGIITWINAFHMPLFFLVTGFLNASHSSVPSHSASNTTVQYVRRKAVSLLYPYLTFSLVNLLWYVLFHCILHFGAEETLSTVFLKTVTTYGYHALWFLPALFFASVICFWLDLQRWSQQTFTLLTMILASLFSILIGRFPLPHTGIWFFCNYWCRILLGISFILIGKSVYFLISHHRSPHSKILSLLLLLVSVVFSPLLPNVNLSYSRIGNPLIFYPVACAGSIGLILLCKHTQLRNSRALHFLGRNSLIIMALHMDAPIQIAWVFIGASNLGVLLSPRLASLCAIAVELTLLRAAIPMIHRFCSFLLVPYIRRITCSNTK